MIELGRTMRFRLDPRGPRPPRDNTFAAWPPLGGLGPFLEAEVCCRGDPDPETGYFMNITRIDEAFRAHALPVLEAEAGTHGLSEVPVGGALRRMVEVMQPPLGASVVSLELRLSPFCRLLVRSQAMNEVVIRQQYEFSAAHRLHVESLSAEENRRVFGKCNNPSGHGHNYRLEVAVRAPVDPGGRVLETAALDALVNREVIEHLDHKHLNCDVPAFEALNPSVENIAITIWGMLAEPVATLATALEEIRVWETGKTVCTYRGPG